MFRAYAVAILAAVFFSASTQASPNKGVVRSVRGGSAEISNDSGKSWKKAAVGMPIAAHSAIKTDASAVVDVFLGDNGPVVRVNPSSQLGFDKLDVQDAGIEKVIETQLDLKSGRILGNVKKMAAASKYEVKTPHGVAGIRGTEYSISADGTVSVVSGTVVVVYIVDNVPQPPITISQGNQTSPPTSNGGTAQIVQSTVTPGDIAQINVGIAPRAGGGYTLTLDDGKTLTFDANGKLVGPIDETGGTVNLVTPDPKVQPNPNRIADEISPIQPSTGNSGSANSISGGGFPTGS